MPGPVRSVPRAHDRHDGLRLHDGRHRHGEVRRGPLPPRLQPGEEMMGTINCVSRCYSRLIIAYTPRLSQQEEHDCIRENEGCYPH